MCKPVPLIGRVVKVLKVLQAPLVFPVLVALQVPPVVLDLKVPQVSHDHLYHCL